MGRAPLDLDGAADLAVPSLLVLEVEGRPAIGARIAGDGLVVTALSSVANAAEIAAHLPDGRVLEISEVAAVDERIGIAVLVLHAGLPSLVLSARHDLVADELVFAQAMPADRSTIVQTRLGPSKEAADGLTVVLLPALSVSATGTPVLDRQGDVVAVATRMMSNAGPVMVGIPAREIASLLVPGPARGLSALGIRRRGDRAVPDHPPALLVGSARPGLDAIAEALVAAINVGAPAYNSGDVAGCYRVYVSAAESLVAQRDDCPGAQMALREGLQRARELPDVEARAWAMRDAFDGLLAAIERHVTRGGSLLN